MQSCFLPAKYSVNSRKGQTEFIVIIVLIAIGVGTVSYAAFKSSPGIGGGVMKGTAEESIASFISEAGYKTLETMSVYGGFLGPQENYAQFVKQHGVPVVNYHYYGGELTYPTEDELKANLIAGVSDYIRTYKDALGESLKSQGVVISDSFTVDAKIMPNKVLLTVNMPTTVRNQSAQQPFQVEMLTRFGEVYAAAKSISGMEAGHRFFEAFTGSKILSSGMKDGKPFIPTVVSTVGCEPVHIGWSAIKGRMETAIEEVVSRTQTAEGARSTDGDYVFPISADGNGYKDLSVSFFTAANFALDEETVQFRTLPGNAVNVISMEPVPDLYVPGTCKTELRMVEYYVKYPVIVVIKDDVTKDSFRFALEVAYKTDYAGTAGTGVPADFASDSTATVKDECGEMKCQVKVPVEDYDGKAIQGASVRFGGCPLGETDADGIFRGAAPCITGKLEVSKQGYGPSWKMASVNELIDAEAVLLKKMGMLKLYIYEVPVTKEGTKYSIKAAGVKPSSGESFVEFANLLGLPVAQTTIKGASGEVELTPGTIYGMLAKLTNPSTNEDLGEVAGFSVLVGGGTEAVHVYVPKLVGFQNLRGAELLNEIERLTNLLSMADCGFSSPGMSAQAAPKDCVHDATELKPSGGSA